MLAVRIGVCVPFAPPASFALHGHHRTETRRCPSHAPVALFIATALLCNSCATPYAWEHDVLAHRPLRIHRLHPILPGTTMRDYDKPGVVVEPY
jgi:hypothetical protein